MNADGHNGATTTTIASTATTPTMTLVNDETAHSYPPATSTSATAKADLEASEHKRHDDRPPTRTSSYATANSDAEDSPTAVTPAASAIAAIPPASVPAQHDDRVTGDDNAAAGPATSEAAATAAATVPPSPTTTLTPAAQLRLSLARRLWKGLSQLRSRSRISLLFQAAFTVAQVAAYAAMLGLSSNQQCEKPLRTFVALHIVRVAISYPISFYNALAPPRRPPRGEEDTPESRARREARRVVGNPRLDSRLRTASDLIGLFSLIWFFLGNVWVYSGTQCKDISPYLWYSSLSILIIAYLRVAEMVVIVLAVVFFLPLVILGLRMFGGLEKKHEIGPLSKAEVEKLPTVFYVPQPEADKSKAGNGGSTADVEKNGESSANGVAAGGSASDASNANKPDSPVHITHGQAAPASPTQSEADKNAKAPRRKRHLLRLLFKKHRSSGSRDGTASKGPNSPSTSVYVSTKHPLHPLPDNLSSCPICLCDYEPPPLRTAPADEASKALEELEPLILLPCGHCIHKECLGPWLQTSGRCPVCQRAVLGDQAKKSKTRLGRTRRRRGTGVSTSATTEVPPAPTTAAAAAAVPPTRTGASASTQAPTASV